MTRPDDPGPTGPVTVPDRPSRIGLVAGIAITVVAIAVAIAFALPSDDERGRLVGEVAAVHELQPQDLPPASLPDASAPRDSFSDFAARAGWLPVGARTDRVGGREALTVYWGRAGRLVAYTLLPGEPALPPEDARRTGRRGVLLYSFDAGARTVVTWLQDGRTAVVSAIGVPRGELYDLAGGPPRP
jgi:hypothetical protein